MDEETDKLGIKQAGIDKHEKRPEIQGKKAYMSSVLVWDVKEYCGIHWYGPTWS